MVYIEVYNLFGAIFVCSAKYGLECIFFMWISNCCSPICRKDCLFSTEFPLEYPPCMLWVCFCVLYSISLISLSILMSIAHYFSYYCIIIRLEVKYCSLDLFFLILSVDELIWCFLCFKFSLRNPECDLPTWSGKTTPVDCNPFVPLGLKVTLIQRSFINCMSRKGVGLW